MPVNKKTFKQLSLIDKQDVLQLMDVKLISKRQNVFASVHVKFY